MAGGGAGGTAEGREQGGGGRGGGDGGLGRTAQGAGGSGGQQHAAIVKDAEKGQMAAGGAEERRQGADCTDPECGLCELGGVKAVRVNHRADSVVSVEEFEDCEEGTSDEVHRPRPVFRKELGEDAEKIDVLVDVHSSDDDVSVKGEKEKSQVHNSEGNVHEGVPAVNEDSESGVLEGAYGEDGVEGVPAVSEDSESGVPGSACSGDGVEGVPAVSEDSESGALGSACSGDGVEGVPAVSEDSESRVPVIPDGAQAPVDREDVGSGGGAPGGGEEGDVSARDAVWEEVRKVKNGSFILEQGPRSPVFKEIDTPIRITSYLSSADEFSLKNGAWYLSGGNGGSPPSASWPNQAWSTPSASGRPRTGRSTT